MKIEEFLEKKVKRNTQIKLLIVSSLFWATAAAGVMVMSLTLPKISAFYNIPQTKTSLIASFTFLGMLVGATIFGNLADYFGRKALITATLILAAVFTALTGVTLNFNLLLVVRFMAGLGMGGLLPVVNAYLAEFSPKFVRGRNLVLLEASWAIGSIIIGIVAVTVGKVKWQIDYYVFILTLAFLLALIKIPESPKFLLKKKRIEALKENLKQIGIQEIPEIEFEEEKTYKVPIANLFKKGFTGRTLMVWYMWFAISFAYYGFFSWLPKIISKLINTTLTTSTLYVFTLLVMQLPGYLLAAYFVEKIGRKITLFVSFLLTGIMAYFFARSGSNTTLLINGSLMTIFCMSAWGVVYAYTPELFPTEFRASANGSAGSWARVAGIIAPLYISILFNKNLIFAITFLGIILLIAAMWVLIKGVETRAKEIG